MGGGRGTGGGEGNTKRTEIDREIGPALKSEREGERGGGGEGLTRLTSLKDYRSLSKRSSEKRWHFRSSSHSRFHRVRCSSTSGTFIPRQCGRMGLSSRTRIVLSGKDHNMRLISLPSGSLIILRIKSRQQRRDVCLASGEVQHTVHCKNTFAQDTYQRRNATSSSPLEIQRANTYLSRTYTFKNVG